MFYALTTSIIIEFLMYVVYVLAIKDQDAVAAASSAPIEEIISQLGRIGGASPLGFGPGKILSLPDALSRVLAEHIGQLKPGPATVDAPAETQRRIGDLCKECGQATFVYEEGCKKCLSCGFNEC